MRFAPVVVILACSLWTLSAQAASFDCKAASGKIETMICADKAISALDSQLAAAYAHLRQRVHDDQGEKTMQLAWLRSRNACADAACLGRIYERRIAELQARAASASPLVGFWKKEYACVGATEPSLSRCTPDQHDVFMLRIQAHGNLACVIHMATAQLGNRVDEGEGTDPTMTGTIAGDAATVHFTSGWGATGTATLRVQGNQLVWKITAQDAGQTWMPKAETLTRVPAGQYDLLPACAG